jgi:hypothetical protein
VQAERQTRSSGDPGGSRTPNPQIRSLMLYPIELRGRCRNFTTDSLIQAQSANSITREMAIFDKLCSCSCGRNLLE